MPACAGGQESARPSGPARGFENAYAAPGCAPWDGYAVSLVLRGDTLAVADSAIEHGDQPRIQVSLYPRAARGDNPSGLAPAVFAWPVDEEVANASVCTNGRCEGIPRGRLQITAISPTGDFSGDLEMTLKDQSVIRGLFHAKWRQRTVLCG
jgi:hypothetical protein